MKIGIVSREVFLKRRADFAEELRFVTVRSGLEDITAADFVNAQPGDAVMVLTGQAAMGCRQGICIDAAVIGILGDTLP